MKASKNIFLFVLALIVAYGGGYYFGRYPEFLREIIHSRPVVIATTDESILPPEIENWIEDNWDISITVLPSLENDLSETAITSDIVIAPRKALEALPKDIKRPFDKTIDKLLREDILADLLFKSNEIAPLLWKLLPPESANKETKTEAKTKWQLSDLGFSVISKRRINTRVVEALLSRQTQILMSQSSGYLSVRKDLLTESGDDKKLRSIPLSELEIH